MLSELFGYCDNKWIKSDFNEFVKSGKIKINTRWHNYLALPEKKNRNRYNRKFMYHILCIN